MLSLTILADLHLRSNEPYDGVGYSRLDEKLNCLKAAVDHAVKNNHRMLILAGDIFDSREPPEWLRAKFLKELAPCFGHDVKNVQVSILVGNHETNGETHCYESLQTLQSIPGLSETLPLHIISKPMSIVYHRVQFNLVPYLKSAEAIDAVTKWTGHDATGDKLKILIGHFQVDGAELSGGNAFQIPTILRPHHFSGYDLTILGHVHQRQIHSNDDITWSYIGSPLPQDFGERDDTWPKGFYSLEISEVAEGPLDTDRCKLKPDLQLIPFESTPFIQLEITEEEGFDDDHCSYLEGVIAKVVFVGSEEFLKGKDVQEWRKHCRQLDREGYAAKIICETRCTDRQITQEIEEPDVKLDDSMKRLCKERNRELFLPDGIRFVEEAHNEIARD